MQLCVFLAKLQQTLVSFHIIFIFWHFPSQQKIQRKSLLPGPQGPSTPYPARFSQPHPPLSHARVQEFNPLCFCSACTSLRVRLLSCSLSHRIKGSSLGQVPSVGRLLAPILWRWEDHTNILRWRKGPEMSLPSSGPLCVVDPQLRHTDVIST